MGYFTEKVVFCCFFCDSLFISFLFSSQQREEKTNQRKEHISRMDKNVKS